MIINENTYDLFLNNTSHNHHKIIIQKGLSIDILPTLLVNNYHFIYIDGDHSEKSVWYDAIHSFRLLKINGYIIFDDYIWGDGEKSPHVAIDKFLDVYKIYIEVISIFSNQVVIRKIADFQDYELQLDATIN